MIHLLGLAALPIAAAAMPQLKNYMEGTVERGRASRRQSLLDGVDMEDPSATAQALFLGGMLNPNTFQVDSRTGYEGNLNRQSAERRAGMAAGTAAARLAFDKQKWAVDPLNPESPTYGNMTPAQQAAADVAQMNAETSRFNAETTRLNYEHDVMLREQERAAAELAASEAYRADIQPLLNQVAEVDYALTGLDQLSINAGYLTDEQDRAITRDINQLMIQRMGEFQQMVFENEPAQRIQEEILNNFSPVEGNLFGVGSERERERVRDILQQMKSLSEHAIEQRAGVFQRSGNPFFGAPMVGHNSLSGAWEVLNAGEAR